MDKVLKAGAIFAGIGGFCLGFYNAGIQTVWAIDNDEFASETYKNNIKYTTYLLKDVRTVFAKDLEPVDVLDAGFPCQSFSQAGDRKGFNDERGKLFYELIRIIKEFKDRRPSIIVFENSPHLRHGDGGRWFLEITKEIKKAGYWFRETSYADLDAYDITTLPQRRNRLFMVGLSTDYFDNGKFVFPSSKINLPKNLEDYINFWGEIPDESYYLPSDNKYYRMINDKYEERCCIYQLRKFLVRVKNPGECPTLTANMGQGGHNVPFIYDNKGLRKLTEYECLALQGFPPTFIFPKIVPRAKRYVQIGNAVCVPVAELIAKQIISTFHGVMKYADKLVSPNI